MITFVLAVTAWFLIALTVGLLLVACFRSRRDGSAPPMVSGAELRAKMSEVVNREVA